MTVLADWLAREAWSRTWPRTAPAVGPPLIQFLGTEASIHPHYSHPVVSSLLLRRSGVWLLLFFDSLTRPLGKRSGAGRHLKARECRLPDIFGVSHPTSR